jgi:hypothetical protein
MQRILGPTILLSVALACSAEQPGVERKQGGSGAGDSGASGGSLNLGGTTNVNVGGIGGNTPALNGMIVSDSGTEITVTGQPAAVSFTVELDDGSIANDVIWTVDDTRIGSIGDDGVFHADGYVGGVVVITAMVNGAEAKIELTVYVDITENPGAVADGDQATLIAGGTGDAGFTNLYPYDGTVFPRGLGAPVMQYAGTAATQSYTLIEAPYFKYQQFAGASTPTRITLPDAVWRGLTLTMINNDPVTVSVSKSSGGTVTGPVTTSWHIAPGQLKGMFYYATYKSPLAMEVNDVDQGAIMRLRPGGTAEVVQGGCTVCHSVSARGNVLTTGLKYLVQDGDPENLNPVDSSSYNLTPDGQMTERMRTTNGRMFAFSGLSPDGAIALTNGIVGDGSTNMGWPPLIPHGVRAPMGYPSQLVDTATATPIDSPSLTASVTYAITPTFSPDGTRVAFINGDMYPNGRVLSVMDFDGTSTFSNMQDAVSTANVVLAWPTFLPDGQGVIYHEGDSFDTQKFNPDATAQSGPQYGDLRLASLGDQSISDMNLANGYDAAGESYLPAGAAEEGRMNYEPSVLPIAVGGYYWVLFTSRRTYGNTISPGGSIETPMDPWGTASDPSPRKKIWIAAIDVDYAGKVDATHPAFYLPGQEVESGNMRAYAALAPCKPDGETCESGADCCNGFCRETSRTPDGQPVRECIPPPVDTCSEIDELCETAADCCDPENWLCINGRCALPPPK